VREIVDWSHGSMIIPVLKLNQNSGNVTEPPCEGRLTSEV
jgi:hypothetical protein